MKYLFGLILFCLFPLLAQAQLAPVAVSSLATVGSTVTATTGAAHGLAVNQGFCLSSPSLCGVVLTAPTSTTFTFSGNQTCAPCGTVQAAKQIVILQASQPTANQWSFRALFWLTTPQGVTGSQSSWSGASLAENTALGQGLFVEQSRSYAFATSVPMTTVKAIIQADYSAAQAVLAQSFQPGQFYGVFFNGGWSQ